MMPMQEYNYKDEVTTWHRGKGINKRRNSDEKKLTRPSLHLHLPKNPELEN